MVTLDDHRAVRVRRWCPDDLPGLVALAERAGVPASHRGLRAQLTHQRLSALRPDRHLFLRLVAEVEGEIVGTAVAQDQIFVPRGWLVSRVYVNPGYRGCGIGSSLASAIDAELGERQPAGLVGRVGDRDTSSLAWAQRRGFAPGLREVRCVLDLRAVPPNTLSDRRIDADGPTFFSMSEGGAGREWPRVYELLATLLGDIPEMTGAPGPSTDTVEYSFTHWMPVAPDATWVAAEGGRLVGVTISGPYGPGGLYTWFTGVVSDLRGKGIARALKLLAVESARSRGIWRMFSEVVVDTPMLALNRSLGCSVEDPVWVVRRPLAS